jgi:gliding motility-associated-like protein
MTGFEKHLKNSLRDFQPDTSGKNISWDNIQKSLNAKRRAKYFYGIAASAIVVVSAFALWPTNEPLQPTYPIEQPDSSPINELEVISTPKTSGTATEVLKAEPKPISVTPSDNNNTIVTEPIAQDSSDDTQEKIREIKPTKEHSDKDNFFAELSVNNAKVCPGEKIQFHLSTKEPVMVEWIFSNGIKSEEPNPSFIATKAGTYAASVKLTSLVTGKVKTLYLSDGFEIYPKNNYNIEVDEIHADNFERKYHLNVDGKDIISVNWIGIEKNDDVLKIELNERGHYQYTAEVFDINGCKTVLSKSFDVETDNNLLAPTAFTPNGDNVNDEFLPKALHQLDDGKFLFRVINPNTGKILFETTTSSRSWNGINPETGQKMNAGTYVWTSIIYGSKGNKTFQGKISIVD